MVWFPTMRFLRRFQSRRPGARAPAILFCAGFLALACPSAEAAEPGGFREEDVAAATETIRELYAEVLGRAPDPSGLNAFLPVLLNHERDAAGLRKILRNSPEGRARRNRLPLAERGALGVAASLSLIWLGMFALFACVGCGLSEFVAGRGAVVEKPDLFQSAWIGLGGLLAILQLWSLARPLDPTLLGTFIPAAIAAAGWARFMRGQRRAANPQGCGAVSGKTGRTRWSPGGVLLGAWVVGICLVGAAASAQRQIVAYDTFLYHLNAVRWANEYATVPGLANLHVRLGFNSAWLLLAAWLDHGFLDGRTAWVMPGFACAFFLAYLMHVLAAAKTAGPAARMAAFLLLPYGLRELVRLGPHLGYDVPAQFALAAMFVELVRWSESKGSSGVLRAPLSPAAAMCVGVPAAIAFVVKPVGAPALVPVGGLLAWNLWRSVRGSGRIFSAPHAAYGLPALILAGWMARNAVLSGWLLFPAPAGALPVDWAVPRAAVDSYEVQSVEGLNAILQSWPRRPGAAFHAAIGAPPGEWFPDWFAREKHRVEVRWLFPLGWVALGALGWGRGRKGKPRQGWEWAWPATAFAVLAFWFYAAPDLRYGDGLFWIWFALCAGLAVASWVPAMGRRAGWLVVGGAGLALAWGALAQMPETVARSRWAWLHAPSARLELVEVNRQHPPLKVYVPSAGDQCGDSPLPATPYPSDRLQARAPGDLGRGFRRE